MRRSNVLNTTVEKPMSTNIPMPEFDQLADVYWRLGGMQSPSQLHGYLVGQLAVGEELQPEVWLQQAEVFIDAVEPPDEEDAKVLLALYGATHAYLKAGEMELQMLLPDDAVEVTQRVDSIGQWCQGFMAGFAQGGKAIAEQQGQQQYSQDVSEALSDLAAISQISLGDDDTDMEQSEQNVFEITEYLRLAAITIYIACAHAAETAEDESAKSEPDAVGSVNNLFGKTDNKLH